MRQIYRFINGLADWKNPMVDLFLPGQSDAGNQAGTKVNHASVDSRQMGIWVKHGSIIGEQKAN